MLTIFGILNALVLFAGELKTGGKLDRRRLTFLADLPFNTCLVGIA